MSRVFFISDLHLGHENIAKYRGFKDAEEHDNFIIKQWNSVVNKKDTVWIVGDITMEKKEPYTLLASLKGTKNVVLGNHDLPQHVPYLMPYVNKIAGMLKYRGFMVTHAPMYQPEVEAFEANIHGHVHEKSIAHLKYLNVSADVLNYTPILFKKLKERYENDSKKR